NHSISRTHPHDSVQCQLSVAVDPTSISPASPLITIRGGRSWRNRIESGAPTRFRKAILRRRDGTQTTSQASSQVLIPISSHPRHSGGPLKFEHLDHFKNHVERIKFHGESSPSMCAPGNGDVSRVIVMFSARSSKATKFGNLQFIRRYVRNDSHSINSPRSIQPALRRAWRYTIQRSRPPIGRSNTGMA
ncbi:hypothetical protein F5883DRAFT_589868, partial [Diaporthe sp. PMI_573]